MKGIVKLLLALTMIGAATCHANTALSQSGVLSQNRAALPDDDELSPDCHFERALCGYLNQNGETAIEPRFDWADDFSEGRARVRDEGRYGFIDSSGDVVVPAIYDTVSRYWNGVAQVRRNGKTALLDHQGDVVIPAEYDIIIPLDGEHVLVGTGGELHGLRRLTFRPTAGLPRGNYSFLDTETGETTEPVPAKVRFLSSELGSRLWLEVDQGVYLTDTDGRRLSETLDYGGSLHRGRAIVMRDRRYGAVNADGDVVIPLRFDAIFYFSNKWAVFREGSSGEGKFGYIDRDGKVMIGARFDSASPFENDKADVSIGENKFQINRAGAIIAGEDSCQDEVTREKHGDGYRVLGTDHRPLNDEIYSFVDLECGKPIRVCKGERQCGYLNNDGTLIAGRYFWGTASFFDGVAGVLLTRYDFAIIDRNGDFILEPIRPKVSIFYTGRRRIGFVSNGDRILIDRETAEALALDPSPLLWRPEQPDGCSQDGVTIVREGASITFKDRFDKPFIEGKFDYATCFAEGVAWVALPDREQWCQITKRGSVMTETCRCDQPLLIIEHAPPRPAGASCYDHGLEVLRAREHQGIFR